MFCMKPHLNKSLARSNKNPFYQGFLTGVATINLREFFYLSESYLFIKRLMQIIVINLVYIKALRLMFMTIAEPSRRCQ